MERVQGFALPPLSPGRRLQNPVFQFVEQPRLPGFEPVKNVGGQPAVVRPGFQDLKAIGRRLAHSALQALGFPLSQPLRELGGEQFAEQRSDADTGVKAAASSGRVRYLFIISQLWTIE